MLRYSALRRYLRHCERSEAIHSAAKQKLDCFVASAPRNDVALIPHTFNPVYPCNPASRYARVPSIAASNNLAGCCNFDSFLQLTMRGAKRISRGLASIGFANDMSAVMQHGYEKLVRLSNGLRPIDDARLAHGSDLA
jgi:hypothetical protein